MQNKGTISGFLLLLAAVIWGFAFVAQRSGMEYTGPYLFNGIRFLMGGLLLIPVYFLSQRKKQKPLNKSDLKLIIPGFFLFVAASAQQIGMVTTTAGNAGFITGLYMIFVPIFGIFLGHKIPFAIWISVIISVTGLYLLSVKPGFAFASGDLWVLSSTIFWACHVLIISWLVQQYNAILLAIIQFITCGVLSFAVAFFTEPIQLNSILDGWLPLLYGGVMSVGLAFTLQVIGQKNAHPAIASVLLSSESLFAAIGGWIILNERMTMKEIYGCILILSGILFIQIFQNIQSKKIKNEQNLLQE